MRVGWAYAREDQTINRAPGFVGRFSALRGPRLAPGALETDPVRKTAKVAQQISPGGRGHLVICGRPRHVENHPSATLPRRAGIL